MRFAFLGRANENAMQKIIEQTDNAYINGVISLILRLKDDPINSHIEESIIEKFVEEIKAINNECLTRLAADLCTSLVHSSAQSIDKLISYASYYVPTLSNSGKIEAFVAEEYNKAQERAGSPIRAF